MKTLSNGAAFFLHSILKTNKKIPNLKIYFLTAFLILLSGCVSNGSFEHGLFVTMQADPQTIFTDRETTVYVDIENRGERSIRDITVDIFDVGLMEPTTPVTKLDAENLLRDIGRSLLDMALSRFFGDKPSQAKIPCAPGVYERLLPGEFKTHQCTLKSPKQIIEVQTATTVSAKVIYTQELTFTQLIELVSEGYFESHRNDFAPKAGSYVYNDKNVEITVEFSDSLPVIVRNGKDVYMHITIKNIGNGFMPTIAQGRIKIEIPDELKRKYGSDVIQCPEIKNLESFEKTFPRITCKLNLPTNFNLISNYDFIFTLNYDYEVRADTTVTIVR